MALRDQPYLPLYIQDVLTDEKLALCSAEAHGVYLRLLCILHKQETYGLLCLKQKYKQNPSKYINFAYLLSKQMPFEQKQIEQCLSELCEEDVIQITENELSQKRMLHDGKLSLIRAEAGKAGGSTITKQYGRDGFLYWMGNFREKNKIGISVSPKNRLYRLRSDLHLKNFEIQDYFKVDDMGRAEDEAQKFFSKFLDGEWVKLNHEEMRKEFALLKANMQANAKAKTIANSESEYEYENESIYNDAFNKFWEAYPKKRSKGQAEKAFKKLKPDDLLLKTILEKIKLLKLTDDWKKDKGQFIPYPATWLNAKGWEDEIEAEKKSRWS